MPIQHEILPERGAVISRFIAEIDDAEFVTGYRRLYADPMWRPGMDEIADLRDCRLVGLTAEGLEEVAMHLGAILEEAGVESRSAILSPSILVVGMARMYELLVGSNPETVHVFEEVGPMLEWLDRPDDPVLLARLEQGTTAV